MVDLSFLRSKDAKWAVHCPTQRSAEEFVAAMRRQYPSHTGAWLNTTRWLSYKENTVYCPDVNGLQGDNSMTYSPLDFFEDPRNGFTVIAFDSLCEQPKDLPAFDSSDIEILFSTLV